MGTVKKHEKTGIYTCRYFLVKKYIVEEIFFKGINSNCTASVRNRIIGN